MLRGHFDALVLILILLLGTYLSVNFFYGPSWINGADNYIYTTEAHTLTFMPNAPPLTGEDNVKFLLFAGIAFFYLLLGYSLLSSSLFGILCFLGTILTVYLIGKNIHSSNTGLVAAFLYAIFPLVVMQSSNVGDDVPATFFVSLAVLLMLMALRGDKFKNAYYVLSGFISAICYLIVPEGALGALFIIIFLCANALIKKRRKTLWKGAVFCLSGVVVAVTTIMLLGFVLYGQPFFIMNASNTGLSSFSASPGAVTYIQYMFPASFFQASLESRFFPLPDGQTFAGVLDYIDRYDAHTLAFGYFGLALLISAIYLVVRKEKRALVPASWFLVVFLYLGFGSQSFSKYVPVLASERFMILLCPAVVLLIGIALADVLDWVRKKERWVRIASYCLLLYAVLFLFITSYFSVQYIQYSQYKGVLPLMQIGKYLNGLPASSTIFGPVDLPWYVYTNYSHSMVELNYVRTEASCNVTSIFRFASGDYFVGVLDGNYSSCGLIKVFEPTSESNLRNYTFFDHWGMNFYDTAVYRYD